MTQSNDQSALKIDDTEIDLLALVGVLWRGKWWIMLCVIVAIFAAGYYATRVAVPMYPARATIALEGEQQQLISDIESVFAGGGTDQSAINTEIQVMQSRTLIGQLVDELDLTADPEFNGFRENPSLIQRLVTLTTGRQPRRPEGEALRNFVVDALIQRISVSNIRQSLAFNISIETTDPVKSAEIVNALAQIYIDSQVRRKLDETERAISFLSERTTELQASAEALEQELAQRMEASDVIDAELLQAQNLQLRDLRSRVEDAQVRIAEDQALRSAMSQTNGLEDLLSMLEASGDARFSGIIQRYRAGRLGEEATLVALEGIGEDLDSEIRRTSAQLATLQASANELTQQLTVQSEELIEIQQLEREVEASRLLYQTFFTRLQEASVQQGLETSDSRMLSFAVPRGASSPRMVILLALAAVLGGIFGSAIVLVREWRFSGFRTTDEIRANTGVPVLGALPAMAVRGRKQVLKILKEEPNSVFAEAVRNLRTSILMANLDKEPQVILVTSSIPSEGKTTLSLALARYFGSLDNRRVLLVEADIRRQTLRAYVDEDRPTGAKLLDVLLGKSRLEDLDLVDPDLGVEVLMGSGGEFNAADLFESRRFRELIEKLRTVYDHIIIDSPPVLAVSDARVLTRYADLSVFAVRWSFTSRLQFKQGLEMLNSVGSPADGVVMTQVDHRKMKNLGYGGQYGYDGYSSGYYAKD